MLTLPRSIEQDLVEAGLSSTEILILRHLVTGQMMTQRQIAMKTGKSTGVMDQAMKKLLSKNVITREIVNDAPHYRLQSLESIMLWMKEDAKRKEHLLLRRHQNFTSFLASLTQDRARPDLSHFEGIEGIAAAHRKLLTFGVTELLCFLPILHREENHPLHEVQRRFLRERRLKSIFLRVVAHDTPLGRRYQSRDPFEYRKTTLIPLHGHPILFERIIAGNIVACFDSKELRACFLHYPQLAQAERELFLSLGEQYKSSVEAPAEVMDSDRAAVPCAQPPTGNFCSHIFRALWKNMKKRMEKA